MRREYVEVARQLRRVLDGVERWLAQHPEMTVVTPSSVRAEADLGLVTEEQARAVLAGLGALGVVVPSGRGRFRVLHDTLDSSREYRRGVREGLDAAPTPETAPDLCAAVPSGMLAERQLIVRGLATDLRAAVFDLIAAARGRLVLASPFWDSETARDLVDALVPPLRAGVRVDLLGRRLRSADGTETGLDTLRSRLVREGNARVFLWREPDRGDRFGSTTFHFKAAIADDGARAYLGSANFTASGLRSRMELGVMLEGAAAARLAAVVEVALSAARESRRRAS